VEEDVGDDIVPLRNASLAALVCFFVKVFFLVKITKKLLFFFSIFKITKIKLICH